MEHLNEQLRISTLSSMAGVSRSHFFTLFKHVTGQTPLDFFIRARMRHASSLLDTTRLSVKEIAARMGYRDAFYFSRCFKSVLGVSPKEYRDRGVQRARLPILASDARRPLSDVAADVRRLGPYQPPVQDLNKARTSDAAKRITASLSYMMQHLNEPLRVSTLSAVAGISATHFFALFKTATGFTPIDFFVRARMHKACELLGDPALKIGAIAAMLGYDDPFYFSRRFKLAVGIPPREYRRRRSGTRYHENYRHGGALHHLSTALNLDR